MVAKRQSLDSWIAEAMTDQEKDGPIGAFGLMHIGGGRESEVHTVRFTGVRSWTASELSLLFRSKAESIAQDLPGAQLFKLLAFYKYNDLDTNETKINREPEAWHPFTVVGEPVGLHGDMVTESPDNKGQTQQGMRHIEVQFAENTRMTRAVVDRIIDLNEQMLRQASSDRREVGEAYKLVREMYLNGRAEEHKQFLEQKKVERDTMLIEKAMSYAPALLNTITNREVFPQATADTHLIETIAKSLTAENVQTIASVLPPEAAGLLMQRFEQFMDKQQIAAQSATNGLAQLTGEQDAAGELTE
jgi:hypothetical protein